MKNLTKLLLRALVLALSFSIVVVLFSLGGCRPVVEEPVVEEPVVEEPVVEEPVVEEPAVEEKIIIGASLPQLDAEGFIVNNASLIKEAEENNAEVISFSAENSAEIQLAQIEDFIARQVDAIIFVPVDADALVVGVEKANEANIPIVAMDRSTTGGTLTGLVESDNVAHGKGAANLMAEAAEKAGIPLSELKVLELLGDQATSAGLERHQGFEERANELGFNIVASLPTYWQNDEAYAATLDAFTANPDINAIFEASDIAMHLGVESALSGTGRLKPRGEEGHIIITSVDGGSKGMEAIREGYIDGIAAQQLIIMGKKSVEIAIKAVRGEPIEESIIRLEPDLVTPENVDSEEHWANQL